MPCRRTDHSREPITRGKRLVPGFVLLCAYLLALCGAASAQLTPPRPLVTDRLDETRLVALQGNTHPLARPEFDQGPAPSDLPIDRILLVLKRSPEQDAALQDLLEQQQETASPDYHKWLTPDQFGRQFGPAEQDIQALTSWLASHGFQSIQVSRGRTVVEFSGTASQVESALHTSIHRYVVDGENHWANAGDPQIPAALAPVISGIVSLHDFRRKTQFARSGRQVTATMTPGEKPQVNLSGGAHAMGPADFNVLYNIPAAATGSGTTIAVVARTNIHISDVTQFRGIFGAPANDPIIVVNGTDPGDVGGGEEVEAVLDATWSAAIAPAATVKLVVSKSTNSSDGTDLSEIFVIDNNLGDVMTESFGTCEAGFSGAQGAAAAATISALAQQAAAQGITYLVSSGDAGPDGCDAPGAPPTPLTPASANILASTPFTVAVGGTEFNENGNPNTYWNASNGANLESAKSYIPENVWNESCTGAACGALTPGLWSSGGGQSTFVKKPSWQSGVAGIPAINARFLPDISATAADHDGYMICLDGSCAGASPSFPVISGTSASVQAVGGIMALVVQKVGARLGQANTVLYKLAAGETLANCNGSNTAALPAANCIFNDVTTGNTNIPGESGFSAGSGYDEATGLGSANVTNLLNNWTGAIVNGSTTTLTLNGGAAVNVTHGTSVPVSITVAAKAPASGTPTGDASVTASTGQAVDSVVLTSSGGNGTFAGTTNLLPGGTYTVTAHYSGDGTFLASDSAPPINVTVTPEASKTAVAIVTPTNNNATSIVYGSGYLLSADVTNAAGTMCNPVGGPGCPTGSANLTDNGSALDNGSYTLTSLGFFQDTVIQLPVGMHNIVVTYAGDSSFNGSTSITDVVTVTKAATTATVTSALNGVTVTLTGTVATTSNAIASAQQEPTGTVQFLVGGVAFGSAVAVTGGVNGTTSFAQATASLSTAALPTGQSNITAQYSGDNNYSGSAISAPIVVTVGPDFAMAANPTSTTVTAGNSVPVTLTVTGSSGYAGTINFTPASCSGLPFDGSCTFNPASVTGSGQTVLTISTKSAFLVPQNRPWNVRWPLAGVATFAVAGILGILSLFAPRRRLIPIAGFLAILCVALACGGCKPSAGGTINATIAGTPAGSSNVTVTAVAGGVTHTLIFGLTVQ